MKPGWTAVALLYMGGMFFMSGQSTTPVPVPEPWDKVAHTIEYTVLGFLLGKATGSWTLAWVLAAWYGALDEVHQSFVAGRSAGMDDWWFDLLGGFVGSRLGAGKRKPRQEESLTVPYQQNFD